MISCPPEQVHHLKFGSIEAVGIVENRAPRGDRCGRAESLTPTMVRRFYGRHRRFSGTLTHRGVRYRLRMRDGTRKEDDRYGDELIVLIAHTGNYTLRVYVDA